MIGGSGRNGFGLGLVVGICFSLLFFFWTADADHALAPTEISADQQQNPSAGWEIDGAVSTSEDTLAQWVMAVFGVIAAGLSGWAIALLRATLIETQKANKNASEGTRAAAIAATVAIEDRRPWIDFTVEPNGQLTTTTDGVSFRLLIKIRNIGHSPAMICAAIPLYYDGANYRDEAVNVYADGVLHDKYSRHSRNTIFPGQEDQFSYAFVGPCNALTPVLWMDGKREIAIGITVVYESRLATSPHKTHRAYSVIAGPSALFIPNETTFDIGDWSLSIGHHPTYAD